MITDISCYNKDLKNYRICKNLCADIGRLMPDIHFIWRPANWPDRPNRALRAFHGFGEYLVGFYGFNACRQSRWFAHRTFIFCGRQSCGLTDGPLFSCQIFMVVYHATALSFIALSTFIFYFIPQHVL